MLSDKVSGPTREGLARYVSYSLRPGYEAIDIAKPSYILSNVGHNIAGSIGLYNFYYIRHSEMLLENQETKTYHS